MSGKPRCFPYFVAGISSLLLMALANVLLPFSDTDTVNPEFEEWIQQDAMVMSWIKSSVHPTLLAALIGKTSSHSAWTCLRERYDLQSTDRLLQLRSELMNTHCGDSSIVEFLDRVNCLADTLSLSGAPVSDSDIVAIVLNNVGPAYESTVASAQACDEAISYSALEALLLSAEGSQKMDTVSSDDSGPTALAATRGGRPVPSVVVAKAMEALEGIGEAIADSRAACSTIQEKLKCQSM